MYKLDSISKKRLLTCHPKIQLLCSEVLKHLKFRIDAAHLTRTDQEDMYRDHVLPDKHPNSPHNNLDKNGKPCSLGIRLIPFDIKGEKEIQGRTSSKLFHICFFAGYVKGIAYKLGIKLEWSGKEFTEHTPFCDNYIELYNWVLKL